MHALHGVVHDAGVGLMGLAVREGHCVGARTAPPQLPDDTVLLSDDDEEHTRAMLLCVDDFFKNLYSTVSQYDICHPLLEAPPASTRRCVCRRPRPEVRAS